MSRPKSNTPCSVPGCDRLAVGRALCGKHWQAWRKWGDPLGHEPTPAEKLSERFWANVDKNGPVIRPELGPCWLWTGRTNEHGYGVFYVWYGPKIGRLERAHRVAWRLLKGEALPDDVMGCHKCDNPPCVRPDHIFPGNSLTNSRDMENKGRHPTIGKEVTSRYRQSDAHIHGEAHYSAKLTEQAVREIRLRYAAGDVSYRTLASEYGVRIRAIMLLVHHVTWKHVI